MESKKLLSRFRLRLLGHCLLRSSLWGLAIAGASVFLCSFVWHLLLKAPATVWLLGSLGIGFLLGFIPSFIKHFPTPRRTARRLDRTGLQERAGTMLAYEKKEGLLVQLQRQDAKVHIENTKTGILQMEPPIKALICCMLCVCLGVTMVLLPYDLFAPKADSAAQAEDAQIRALIDDLRQQIRDAQLAAAVEEELQAILDQLEKDLLATDNELERAALVQQAQQSIEESMFMTISRYAIGKALQGYTLTENLGVQLSSKESPDIPGAMDDMQRAISGPTKQLSRLSNNLTNALNDSGVDPADQLYTALADFAQGLLGLSQYTEGPDATPAWTQEDLTFLFDMAEEAILMALEEQAILEGEIGDVSSSISSSLNELLENQDGETVIGDNQQGTAQSGGSNPSGGGDNGTPSGTPSGGLFDSGDSNSGPSTMLEGIYDPISGNVTYGEVFAAYYAQYLEALDAGQIPDELRPYFERYFSSLS